ncbi:MAG: zinc dependent phospholipase C family protein [Gemmatimonadota bacterium]
MKSLRERRPSWGRIGLAFAGICFLAMALPHTAHAWTPGTHIFLGQSVLNAAAGLPSAIGDLIRAFPFDFLYGNIAADTSFAKKYAPINRHSHAWHVGQEVHDFARSDALRAFGLGYLSHLAADTVAHNFFVPRQLLLTSSTKSFGHSYWESRVETHLDDSYAHQARDLIMLDHGHADAHLDEIISPTIFSVKTNRAIFRGMVHVTRSRAWQTGMRAARDVSRWDLTDYVVEQHLALAYEYIMEMLASSDSSARGLDPNGHAALRRAKAMRRSALMDGGWKDADRMIEAANQHFGLPSFTPVYWPAVASKLLKNGKHAS